METQVVDGEERFLVFFLELLPTQTNAINYRGVLLRFWSDERPRAAVADECAVALLSRAAVRARR